MKRVWSFRQFSVSYPDHVWNDLVDFTVIYAILISLLILGLMYPMMYQLLRRHSSRFRELGTEQQLVTVHHAVEFGVLTILFLPFTYSQLVIFFQEDTSADAIHNKQSWILASFTFMCTIIVMYLIEIASRITRPRPLLLFHHVSAYLSGTLFTVFPSTVNARCVMLLVYCVCFEAPLFGGLVLYRLAPQHPHLVPLLKFGKNVFALTRPLQLALVVGTVVAVWDDSAIGYSVLQLFLVTLFTTLQFYTLTIHTSIIDKAQRQQFETLIGQWASQVLSTRSLRRSVAPETSDDMLPSTAVSI